MHYIAANSILHRSIILTPKRELLFIVKIFEKFRNILLGQQIKVCTDHKNLTFKAFNAERVMRWRPILEVYDPELIYIQGSKNIIDYELIRLSIVEANNPIKPNMSSLPEHLTLEKKDVLHPVNNENILRYQ